MLLLMLLTTASAWAFKSEEKSYRINSNGAQFSIFPSGQSTPTASWAATRLPQTNQTIYYWEKNDSHNFDGDMTISPNADVYSTSSDNTNWIIHTNVTTTFTFNAPSGIITNVRFRNGNADVTPSSSSGAGTSEYKVALASSTTFTGFEVTFYATSGSCGDNATWELTTDDSGNYTVLTIGGSGAMNNYGHTTVDDIWRTDAPWGYDLTSVTIGNDITSIGDYAFIGCQQLSSLTIGSGVTTIGTNAIDHCDGLTEVTLPASVSNIGAGGFKNCAALTRVNIQYTEGLVTLGSSCFNGCNNLQYIVAPTPALALQYKDATNWSASAGKLRVALGDYLFTATDEGGTAAYAITNETDLRNLSAAVKAGNTASGYTFRQTANITLGNTGFIPIGHYGKTLQNCFCGTYDGGDYTISGLQISKLDDFQHYGLFGQVSNGTVKNVRLISPSVNVGDMNDNYCYSALVATANSSTVKDCVVITPTIEGSGGRKGAIIGSFDEGYLQNLYFYGGNCNIAVGAGLSHISTVCRARKVTLGSGIGSVSPDANSMDNGFVYNNERYYREKLTLTLTTNLSEKSGYHIVYKVNGKILDGNTYTVNSTDGDVTLTAEYTPDIHYIDADGNRQTRSDYTVLTNATNISNLSAGWYVVESNVSYSSRFFCESGDIHLILCDNAKMTIEATQTNAMTMLRGSLTVYAQSTGNSMGQLEAISSNGTAISSNVVNNITICGGKITATGSTSYSHNGIYADGNITIHGGQVSATGKYGIRAYEGNVILGLRNANDYITANRYNSNRGSIRIADGQTLTAGTAIYSGTLTDAQISAIGGKTLRRAYSTTLTVSGHGSVALGGTVGVLTDGKIYAASGETVTLSDTPEAGYMVGYAASGVTVTNGTFTMPANDNAAIAASFTAITYDIIYHANGGTLSTNKNSYTVESPDITLDVPTRTGYTFLGWYDNSGLTGTAVTTIAHGSTGNVELWAKWINSTSYYFGPGNDGSTEHPYVISDADGWNYFCDALADGETFSGKTVKLGDDISVTRMAGSDGHRFMGTFDGDGKTLTVSYEDTGDYTMTAPFSYVDGATIRNLVVGGSITDTGFRAAGIIGETSENLSHITNCMSSVNISGNRYIAGFSVGGNVAIEGCVFNGKIVGTQYSGGFVGWSYNGLAITNCLFAPQDGSSISGGTFYYNGGGGDITPTNSYYTTALGTPQGAMASSTATLPANIGTAGETYGTSGITPYTSGLKYGGLYYMTPEAVSLADNAANDVDGIDGYFADVTLSGRTLYKDGAWNTLCLPFGIDDFSGTPLAGATVMTLGNSEGCNTGFDASTGTLNLDFVDADEIEAGVAYIVKWGKPEGYIAYDGTNADACSDLVNPTFSGVTVENENPADKATVSQDDYVQFVGTYDPVSLVAGDRSILYLGSGNQLYWPDADMPINAFRAYFQLKNGLTAGDVANARLLFGDGDETQGISLTPDPSPKGEGSIYTLDGVKLDKAPTRKGLYIHGGCKVVVK